MIFIFRVHTDISRPANVCDQQHKSWRGPCHARCVTAACVCCGTLLASLSRFTSCLVFYAELNRSIRLFQLPLRLALSISAEWGYVRLIFFGLSPCLANVKWTWLVIQDRNLFDYAYWSSRPEKTFSIRSEIVWATLCRLVQLLRTFCVSPLIILRALMVSVPDWSIGFLGVIFYPAGFEPRWVPC